MEALRSDSQEQALKRQQMEGQVNVLNEQILAGVQNEEHYQGRLASIEEELSGKKSSIKELQEEKSDLRAQLKEIQSSLKEKEEKLQNTRENIEICTQAVEEGKNEIIEILNSRSQYQGKSAEI